MYSAAADGHKQAVDALVKFGANRILDFSCVEHGYSRQLGECIKKWFQQETYNYEKLAQEIDRLKERFGSCGKSKEVLMKNLFILYILLVGCEIPCNAAESSSLVRVESTAPNTTYEDKLDSFFNVLQWRQDKSEDEAIDETCELLGLGMMSMQEDYYKGLFSWALSCEILEI